MTLQNQTNQKTKTDLNSFRIITDTNCFWDIKLDIYTYWEYMNIILNKMQNNWFSLIAIHDLIKYWPTQQELMQDYNMQIIMIKEKDYMKDIYNLMTK